MKSCFKTFWSSEDGAVTVDWVVLTGGLLILGIVVTAMIANGATNMSGSAGNRLGAAVVPDIHF